MFYTDVTERKPRIWMLRWRFDFAGRPSKYGHWGRSEANPQGMAAFQLKEGLVRAAVEGKHQVTKESKIFAECDGWDYNVFKWMATAHAPVFMRGEVTPYTRCVGLKLVTRDKEIEVYDTGDVLISKRDTQEMGIHYATFGR